MGGLGGDSQWVQHSFLGSKMYCRAARTILGVLTHTELHTWNGGGAWYMSDTETVCYTDNAVPKSLLQDSPGGPAVESLPENARDAVRSLVQEDPTCHRATKLVGHNY